MEWTETDETEAFLHLVVWGRRRRVIAQHQAEAWL